MRLILQKTPKERREENPKLPYFRLVLPPEEDGGEWVDIGAFWPAKTGNGYSGQLNEGITINNAPEPKKNAEDTTGLDQLVEEPED